MFMRSLVRSQRALSQFFSYGTRSHDQLYFTTLHAVVVRNYARSKKKKIESSDSESDLDIDSILNQLKAEVKRMKEEDGITPELVAKFQKEAAEKGEQEEADPNIEGEKWVNLLNEALNFAHVQEKDKGSKKYIEEHFDHSTATVDEVEQTINSFDFDKEADTPLEEHHAFGQLTEYQGPYFEIIFDQVRPEHFSSYLDVVEPYFSTLQTENITLIGHFVTEIGRLNEYIQIWKFESLLDRQIAYHLSKQMRPPQLGKILKKQSTFLTREIATMEKSSSQNCIYEIDANYGQSKIIPALKREFGGTKITVLKPLGSDDLTNNFQLWRFKDLDSYENYKLKFATKGLAGDEVDNWTRLVFPTKLSTMFK